MTVVSVQKNNKIVDSERLMVDRVPLWGDVPLYKVNLTVKMAGFWDVFWPLDTG